MIKNFFKVAFRNMAKNKIFAAINLIGLTTGICASVFILLYVVDELSYDRFYPEAENIYRMQLHGKMSDQEIHTVTTNSVLGTAMVAEIPGVIHSTRMDDFSGEWTFRKGDMVYAEEKVFTADSSYFEVFSHPFLQGSKEGALTGPNKVVLTEKLARKYFGDSPAVGETLTLGDDHTEYMVTGVIRDVPANTHLYFEALLSMESFPYMNSQENAWLNNSYFTYVTMQPGTDISEVESILKEMVYENVSPVFQQFMGKSLEELEKEGQIYKYYAVPMLDVHLKSSVKDEAQPQGNIDNVYIMAAIGLFIMIIACINFMNLSTAKSAGRAKEVGLRKTMGSSKKRLVGQFLSESTLYAVLSTILALAIVSIFLPYFNDLAGKSLDLSNMARPGIILGIVLIVLLIGVLAGTYPAFYLTSFEIAETLKGKIRSGMRSAGIRSFLVTFQFWISILLVICTAIVYQQIQFMRDRNLGFDKEKVIMVENMNRLGNNVKVMEDKLNASAGIGSTSFSNNVLPGTNNTTLFRVDGEEDDHILGTYYVDEDYDETLGLEMSEGRFFSKDFPSDSMAVILNEAAVREFGLENPLEARIMNFNFEVPTSMQVIGVIKDFNFESIKIGVRPLILLRIGQETDNVLYVRYDGTNAGNIVSELEDTWNMLSQGDPIEFSFLNQEFDNLFRAEQRLGKLFTIFTGMAILIACLGLFGLASFIAEQRRKEIGVRKVLGASIWNIIGNMSFDFIKLVVIAFVLAVFPAWYIMDRWLNDFSAHIDIEVWVFLLGGILAIGVAWLTVGYQSYKAARANPVKSLRYE